MAVKKSKSKKKYVIGIDLGGTKILVGVLDENFKVLSSVKTKTNVNAGEKVFFNSMIDTIEKALDKAKVTREHVYAIGMGCPGLINVKKGLVVSSPNIGFMKNYPLSQKLSGHFKLPVVLGNDVSVGLYGEQQFGAAKGFNHVVGIFLGTGVGGAFILDGKIYHGANGGAGEIGHTLVNPLGALCGCGKRGCLETELGRTSIAAEAAVLAIKRRAPKLLALHGTDIAKIKSGTIAESIEAGDQMIKDLLINKSGMLGMAIANIVNILNPEMILLGGGLVEAVGAIIVPEADKAMRRYAMDGLSKDVKVVAAKLKDFSVVKGAAKMAAEFV